MGLQRFLTDNVVRKSVAGASYSAPGYPAENIQHPWIPFSWRSTNCGSHEVHFVLPAAEATTGCAFFGCNFTNAATFVMEKWVTDHYETVTNTFEYDDVNGVLVAFWNSTSSTQYRLGMLDAANPDAYYEIGVGIIGNYVDISRGFEFGFSLDEDTTDLVDYSIKGYFSAAEGYMTKLWGITYEVLDADVLLLNSVWRSARKMFPFAYIGDTSDILSDIHYVRFREKFGHKNIDSLFTNISLVMEERLEV